MATNKAKKTTRNTEPVIDPDLPEGFEQADASGGQKTWIRPAEGVIVQGELLGRYKRRGKRKGYFYEIRVTGQTTGAVRKVEDETGEVDVEEGDIVAIDERAAYSSFEDLLNEPMLYEVFIKFKEKQVLEDGNTFWNCATGKKRTNKKRTDRAATNDDGDVPF